MSHDSFSKRIKGNVHAQAFYGVVSAILDDVIDLNQNLDTVTDAALAITAIIEKHDTVDWQTNKGYAIIMTTHMPNHAIILGGKNAILNKSGELICGNTEEIVTDENLQEIYQVDVRVVDVIEAGGKVCVFVQDQAG